MAFYLFPGVMYERLLKTKRDLFFLLKELDPKPLPLKNALQIYNLSIRQHWGFGGLLQFFPWTKAYKARQQLADILEPLMDKAISAITHASDLEDKKTRIYFLSFYIKIGTLLNLPSKLWDLAKYLVNKFDLQENKKLSLIEIALTLPILTDVIEIDEDGEVKYRENAANKVISSILNPAKFIDDLLNFLHIVLKRISEIGSEKNETPSIPRALVKGIVGFIFGLIRLYIIALKNIIDTVLEIAKSLIVEPIIHISTSIQKTFKERYLKKKETLIVTENELRGIQELRIKAKTSLVPSYASMKNLHFNQTEYIGTDKKDIYKPKSDSNKAVAIKGRRQKIEETASLRHLLSLTGKSHEDPYVLEQATLIILKNTESHFCKKYVGSEPKTYGPK